MVIMGKYNRILVSVILPEFNLMNRYSAVASVIYSFVSVLKKDGFDVYVNDRHIDDWENQQANPNKTVSNITKFRIIYLFPKRFREIIKDLQSVFKNRKLKRNIESIPKPDLIISWITYRNSYAVDFAKHWNVPLISIYDNPLSSEYDFLHGFPPFMKWQVEYHEKRSVTESDSLILYSSAVLDYLKKKYPVNGKVYYIAFTDFLRMKFQDYKRSLECINFVYIGSFFNWHKLDDLIEAFRNVNRKYPNSKLYLIGDGPEFGRIFDATKDPNIVFTGRKDGAELDKLIESMHVGVISNALWYQAPVKFFQYAGSQLVVISKKTPTIYELSKGDKCFRFFDSKNELEQQMESVIKDPASIESLGNQSKEYIRNNFSEANYLSLFHRIFIDLP